MYFGIYSKIRHVKQSKGEVYQKNKKQSKVSVMSQKRKKGFDVVKRLKSHEIEIDLFQRAPLTSCSRTMRGYCIIHPTKGIWERNAFTVDQNPPNRTMTPYISKIMPIMGQRTNIRKSPRTKQIVPLKLLTFVNTLQVDCQPSKRPTPINQNKFPRASKPLSKYKMTPRNVKDKPKPMRPNPTFFCSVISYTILVTVVWDLFARGKRHH